MVSRHGAPAAITALLLLAMAAPFGLPGQAAIQGVMALGSVYFWSLFRPASMAPPTVFLLGALVDLLGYAPIGVGALTLLLAHGAAVRWRRMLAGGSFLAGWLGFTGVAGAAAALQWALTSLLTFQLLPPDGGVFQAAVGAGLYPALVTLLGWLHRTLAEPDHA